MYCDYNATAPLRDSVKKELMSAFDLLGNPSAVHSYGRNVRGCIERARNTIADYFKTDAQNVIFTSGATEANNMILKNHKGPVFLSSIEHSSVFNARIDAQSIAVNEDGVVDLYHLESLLKNAEGTMPLVAVMAANNETGVIQPIQDVFNLCKKYQALLHVDAVQAVGKLEQETYNCATTMTISGHKLGALSGIGALIKKSDYHPTALINGGGQERRMRSGTENILGIISLGKAIEDLCHDDWHSTQHIREHLESMMLKAVPNTIIFGHKVSRLPNTIDVAMPGVSSDLQLMLFDQQNIAISSGSACSSGKIQSSRVLKAMNVDPLLINNAIRISFGTKTTLDQAEDLFKAWFGIYQKHHKK